MTLYEQLCSFESLYEAFLRARKGKRKQEEIAAFERNLESELFNLQESLLNQSHQPGGYYSFYRTEAKHRLISAAPFRDRVVHHALVASWNPFMSAVSFLMAMQIARAHTARSIAAPTSCAVTPTHSKWMCASFSHPLTIKP
jgi:hypothetical protein